MEAQAILPVKADGALKQESPSRGTDDVFHAILRENDARDLADRNRAARADLARDRVARDADRIAQYAARAATARRRSDAAQEIQNSDRHRDTPNERPVAEKPPAPEQSAQRDHIEESQPHTERPGGSTESASAKVDPQGQDDTSTGGDTPLETDLGNGEALNLAPPIVATGPALTGTPANTAVPVTRNAEGIAALTPAAATQKHANPKDVSTNTPRPTAPAGTGSQVPLNGTPVTPAPSEGVATPVPTDAKAQPSILPVMPADSAVPLNAAQVIRPQAPGQKAGVAGASGETLEIGATPGKENQILSTAKIGLNQARHKPAANAPSQVKGRVDLTAKGEVSQSPNTNSAPVANDVAANALKTTAPTGNPGQAHAGMTVIDPMQAATRTAGARPSSAPTPERPVPLNEVAVNIQRAAARGDDRIRIRLHPAELGQIDVRLKVGADGTVRAVIQVERPETLDFMQRDARGLERALQEAGLKTDSGSLSFNMRDKGEDGLQNQGGDSGTAMAGHERADADSLSATEAAEIPVQSGWSSRVLDIRV